MADDSKCATGWTMNTRFTYMYRDAGNYKYFRTVVLTGSLDADDLQEYLHEHHYFVPSAVGLDDLQPDPLTLDDHIWHEVFETRETEESPSIKTNSLDLVQKFRRAKNHDWWEKEVLTRKLEL